MFGQTISNVTYLCIWVCHSLDHSLADRTDANAKADWNKVALRTANSPEGPWSADVIVYEPKLLGSYAYAGVAHPYLDSTGQTLTISYTNAPNVIEVIKVSFFR